MDLRPFKEVLEADENDETFVKPPNPFSGGADFSIHDINIDLDRKIARCENYMNAFRDFMKEFYRDEEYSEDSFEVLYNVKEMQKELERYKKKISEDAIQK